LKYSMIGQVQRMAFKLTWFFYFPLYPCFL